MNEQNMAVEQEIGPNFIDLRSILESKNVHLSGVVVSMLNRLLHVRELNDEIYRHRDKFGVDFAKAILDDLGIAVQMEHADRIPTAGSPIIVGNHPLGGPDGMALIAAVGEKRDDVKFPVNDFLMHLPGLRPVFVPVDKVRHRASASAALVEAFAADNALLYFPAGLCSRRVKGKVRDLEWKSTFVKKAVAHHRDVVPVFFDAANRRRFYTIANWRKRLGIKFNFEMALLPGEMFAQRGHTFRLVVGSPVPWQTFETNRSPEEWAEKMRQHVYRLGTDADAQFLKGISV